jgi:hypothetical protein
MTQVLDGATLAEDQAVRGVVWTMFLVVGASCEGVATLANGQPEAVSAPQPTAPTTPPAVPTAPMEAPPIVLPAPERPEVMLPAERLQLLPFEVRLKRLAAAVEVPVTDAVFNGLRSRATDLGAHDFANGVAPDLAWTARRIATWVEGLLPVCADARVRSRYANWSTSLDAFALKAWGRAATSEDRADVVPAQGITDAEAWRATCVSLLSSVELLTP